MAVLLVADHDNTRLGPATAAAMRAAVAMGGPVDVLVAGEGCAGVAADAAALEGAAKVLLAEGAAYAHGLAEPMAALVASLAGSYAHVALAATAAGKNLAPRVAALLDVMVVADVVAIEAPDVFVRPIHAGAALQTVRSRDSVKVVTVRASAFEAAGRQAAAPVETIQAGGDPGLSEWVSDPVPASGRPDLAEAKIVVSGGRALGSAENFKLVEKLADALGAAVGASRAAVDAGFAPNDWQVGQTGKVVAPDLYIALGISGAVQHLAGMKGARVIVAIDTDPEAPIFMVADYGLVADLFEAVPALIEALDRPA